MKLRLKYAHTHAGVAYDADTVLDVDGPAAKWLLDHDRAEEVKQDKRQERKEKE